MEVTVKHWQQPVYSVCGWEFKIFNLSLFVDIGGTEMVR